MLMDLASFSEEGFRPKDWVNAACSSKPADEPVDKYLSEVEMKLQLLAENIAAQLEEQSSSAILRVPRAAREIDRVRDDALSLRGTVGGILQRLEQVEGVSATSVAALSRVDAVKQRMEAAKDTLQDAAGLAQLSASVEDVFASGDLPRVAETLAQMRRCLEVVGEVPEFADVKRQLGNLEDRLEGMVQPKLSEALLARKVEDTQKLRNILIAINRFSSLEQQYTRVRMRPLRKVWEEYDVGKSTKTSGGAAPQENAAGSSASFGEWLPRFYDEVLLVLEQESKWCALTFPEDSHLLVPRLLMETMAAISSSFTARIEAAATEAGATAGGPTSTADSHPSAGGNTPTENRGASKLGTLLSLHGMTGAFARNVQHVLAATDGGELGKVLRAVYSPFEGHKARYGELEKMQLTSEIAKLDLRGAVQRSLGARAVELSETVRRMEASVPAVMVSLEAAIERCIGFTGGSEAEALIRTLDEIILSYVSALFEVLKSLRSVCGVDASTSAPTTTGHDDAGEEDWSTVQGALQLLTVSESLGNRTAVFESTLRNTLGSLTQKLRFGLRETGGELSDHGPQEQPLDVAVLRLIDAPEKAKRLAALLEQAKDPRFHALPHTSQRVQSFQEAVHDLVYDVLIFKVKQRLEGVSSLPLWSAAEEENAFDLPSFSAYPLPYIRSVGEYLLTLPQQLEPLAVTQVEGEAEEGEESFLATEWVFQIAEGATNLCIDQLRSIASISDKGAQQLTADIEYLGNVLGALSVTTPPVLATFQVCLAASRPKLVEIIADPPADVDLNTVKHIARVRHVTPEGTSKTSQH